MTSFLVLSAFLGSFELNAGGEKRKRKEEGKGTTTNRQLKILKVEDGNHETQDNTPINFLPQEVLLSIFSYLNPEDLPHVMGTCGYWNDLAQDKMLLKEFAAKIDPSLKGTQLPAGKTYKQLLESYSKPHVTYFHTPDLYPSYLEAIRGKDIVGWNSVGSLNPNSQKTKTFESGKEAGVKLEDIIARGKESRKLMITLPGRKARKNIFNELTTKLHESLEIPESLKDFQTRIYNDSVNSSLYHERTLLFTIDGISCDGELIYGSLSFQLFAYDRQHKNMFVEKNTFLTLNPFLNFKPKLFQVSRDGSTLASESGKFLFRWKLEKNNQGKIVNSKLSTIFKSDLPDFHHEISQISPDGNIILLGNPCNASQVIWTENSLSTYSLNTLILQGIKDLATREYARNIYDLSWIENITNDGNKLFLYGTGYTQEETWKRMYWTLTCGSNYFDLMARKQDNQQSQIQESENSNMAEDSIPSSAVYESENDNTSPDFDCDELLDLPHDIDWGSLQDKP